MLVTDVFQMSRAERDALTDDQIRAIKTGIERYEPMFLSRDEAGRRWEILRNELYPRVKALQAAPVPAPRTVEYVRCECGHMAPRRLVMSTSRGTSCPDCYDRMSD